MPNRLEGHVMTATITVLPLPVPAPRRPEDPAATAAAASLLAEGFTPATLLARCEPGNRLAARIAAAMRDLLR